ncbi:hypothetical protein ABZP36_000934 [Zizania latifolia]
MKLVAAAKVRRAQEAVVSSRPFSEALVEVLYNMNQEIQTEDIDLPLTLIRPVKKVALVVLTGERGLCGSFNNNVLKKAETRIEELKELGLSYSATPSSASARRATLTSSAAPSSPPSAPSRPSATSSTVYSLFVSEEVDKVELLYSKFISLVRSDPIIRTLLPMSPKGKICDINGVCVDATEDELFRPTTKEGKLTIKREKVKIETQPSPGRRTGHMIKSPKLLVHLLS